MKASLLAPIRLIARRRIVSTWNNAVGGLMLSGSIGGGRRVVYGTDDGVYISDIREANRDPVKVLALLDVLQVDVLEDYQLLIVLSGKLNK